MSTFETSGRKVPRKHKSPPKKKNVEKLSPRKAPAIGGQTSGRKKTDPDFIVCRRLCLNWDLKATEWTLEV